MSRSFSPRNSADRSWSRSSTPATSPSQAFASEATKPGEPDGEFSMKKPGGPGGGFSAGGDPSPRPTEACIVADRTSPCDPLLPTGAHHPEQQTDAERDRHGLVGIRPNHLIGAFGAGRDFFL